uniref:Uncharacterized protein n=1 Tax=Anopheles maculatus TaxID=74869 RepID=A0A182SBE2_9DIPT
MYSLAEQFCMTNPYLKAYQGALEKGVTPVSFLQKPLRDVLQEFIVMQSQLFQLVNLCSSVIEFPLANSVVVLADHLINVLKTSGTAEVLRAVVSTIPCTEWGIENSAAAPTPVPSHCGENTIGSSQTPNDRSYNADDTLLGQDIIINASDVSFIEKLTPFVSSNSSMPIIVENAMVSEPSPTMKSSRLNGMLAGKRYDAANVPPSYVKQSNGQQTTSTPPIVPHQSNQSNKPPQNGTMQQVREPEPTSTSDQPANVQQIASSVPKETTHKLPSSAAASSAVTLTKGATRSNATPLDNPILPGTVSSRSTSSRKRSHIRILDFGTPPFKRGSPSTVGRPSPVIPSPALLSVPKRAVAMEQQPATAINRGYINTPAPPPPPAPVHSIPNEKPKPKKVIVKRRIMRCGVRRQGKRIINTKLCSRRLVARIVPKVRRDGALFKL